MRRAKRWSRKIHVRNLPKFATEKRGARSLQRPCYPSFSFATPSENHQPCNHRRNNQATSDQINTGPHKVPRRTLQQLANAVQKLRGDNCGNHNQQNKRKKNNEPAQENFQECAEISRWRKVKLKPPPGRNDGNAETVCKRPLAI